MNVTFVLGTNFACGADPTNASIGFVRAIGEMGAWFNLVKAIEIGNEIDRFPGKFRPATWSWDDYVKEFERYLDSFAAQGLPKRAVQGGVLCDRNATFEGSFGAFAARFREQVSLPVRCSEMLHPFERWRSTFRNKGTHPRANAACERLLPRLFSARWE